MLKNFSHVGLYVTDMERSLKFYTEKIGLKVLQHFPDLGMGKEIAFIGVDSPVLELLCSSVAAQNQREARGVYDHLAWYVDNIEDSMAAFRSRGIVFSTEAPLVVLDGRKIAFFSGPDGERIEIVELPKS